MKTTMNLLGLLCMMALLSAPAQAAKSTRLTSPHRQISVDLRTEKGQLGWTVSRNGTPVFTLKDIALVLNGQTLGGTAGARSVKQKRVSQSFSPVVPLKHANIQDEYTEAVIGFGQLQHLVSGGLPAHDAHRLERCRTTHGYQSAAALGPGRHAAAHG